MIKQLALFTSITFNTSISVNCTTPCEDLFYIADVMDQMQPYKNPISNKELITSNTIQLLNHENKDLKLDLALFGRKINALKKKILSLKNLTDKTIDFISNAKIIFAKNKEHSSSCIDIQARAIIEYYDESRTKMREAENPHILINIQKINTQIIPEEELCTILTNLCAHEMSHIFYRDALNTAANFRALEIAFDNNALNIDDVLKDALYKEGFNVKPNAKLNKEIKLTLIKTMLCRPKERRADIFAASLVGSKDYSDSILILYEHEMIANPKSYAEDSGSAIDTHDTLEQRIALQFLYHSKKIDLCRHAGTINLQKKGPALNEIALKELINKALNQDT